MNIRYLVIRHAITSEDAHSDSSEYANCSPPNGDAGLDGSCRYSKKRKSSTYQNSGDANGSDVVYRQAM